jgi:ABC-type glycerol-3-phosphate transport system permease component
MYQFLIPLFGAVIMELVRKILVFALAMVLGYFALKIGFWLIGKVFALTFALITLLPLAIVAIPIYLYLNKRLLR